MHSGSLLLYWLLLCFFFLILRILCYHADTAIPFEITLFHLFDTLYPLLPQLLYQFFFCDHFLS